MKFGLCSGIENLELLEQSGADYIEPSVVGLNKMSDRELSDFAKKLKNSKIKCDALNILFPGEMELVGPGMDINKIKEYLDSAFLKVSMVKPEIVVFGSGKARNCPDGFDKKDAFKQLVEVSRAIAEAAKPYGITIALEPLNTSETNMITSLPDGLSLVEAINCDNFKLLADYYHMLRENESLDNLQQCKGVLVHAHIATYERHCPQDAEKDNVGAFLKALKSINYSGRLSIEGRVESIESQIPVALKCFKEEINS